MIAFPAGVKVWIAGGVTDMRCGMNSLALKVQQGLGRDPHGGEIFCFRGRKDDLIKLLWHPVCFILARSAKIGLQIFEK